MTQTYAAPSTPAFVEDVEIQGHIIDSLILPKVLDEILTHGGSYVLKEIRVGQRPTDTSYARIAGSGAHGNGLAGNSGRHSRPWSRADLFARLQSRRARRHGQCVPGRILQHAPIIARKSALMANGLRSRIRRWTAVFWSIRKERRALPPMTEVRKGDLIVVGRARVTRLRGRDQCPAEPVRVHGQPRLQREAQRESPSARSPPPCGEPERAARRSWRCSDLPSSIPAASSISAASFGRAI